MTIESKALEISQRISELERDIRFYELNNCDDKDLDICLDEKRELEAELRQLGY